MACKNLHPELQIFKYYNTLWVFGDVPQLPPPFQAIGEEEHPVYWYRMKHIEVAAQFHMTPMTFPEAVKYYASLQKPN